MSSNRQNIAACQLVIGVDAQPDDIDALWHTRIVPFARNLANQTRTPRARVAVLHEPDPTWPAQAQRLIARLTYATGDHTIRIDHIGSTSVPGLPAKNLVDIQVVVADMTTAHTVAHAATAAGFVRVAGPISTQDRHGIEHPEEVVVDADPGRPTNVNIRAVTDPIWRETLCFRDWLRADKTSRDEYLAQTCARQPNQECRRIL